ncbi:MAG: DUF4830 domain-containing protein [Clostridia bacterium]|nr:DUF4830 domain-containing protein [Clostridia bacterium]
MKAYVTFTKKRFLIILAVFVCIGFICCEVYTAGNTIADAKTNADRLTFIKKLGYTPLCDQPNSKTVNLPEAFYDVYKNYNALQISAGYDLSQYKGCEVTIYTYTINPPNGYTGECVVNLIVYNDRIIGGDISSAALGGFMLPLAREKK